MSAAYLKGPTELPPTPGTKPDTGCNSYVTFDNAFTAARAARRCNSRSSYRCKFCLGYHIGNPRNHPLGKADT